MTPILPLLILAFLFPLTSSSNPSHLVQATCNATSNYRLCVSTLESLPGSLEAKDVKDLSAISIEVALSSSINSSSCLSTLANNATNNKFKEVVRSCVTRYDNARGALQRAIGTLQDESYDYVALHVAAAKEYPAMCSRLFRRYRPGLVYPKEVAARELELEKLCDVALDIVSLLLG